MEEGRRVKEEKDALLRKRKELLRELSLLCQERLPNTKYDRFFVEEFSKKIKTVEAIVEMIKTLKETSTFE